MTMKTTNSVESKKLLIKLLRDLNYFSDIKIFFGNEIDLKRMVVADLDNAPSLAICFPGGDLEEKSKSQGPYTGYTDTNDIYFFLMGRNNGLEDQDDFAFNCIELETAKELIISTVKQNQNYWNITNYDFNFLRYSYLINPELKAMNVNVLALEANHKYKFL